MATSLVVHKTSNVVNINKVLPKKSTSTSTFLEKYFKYFWCLSTSISTSTKYLILYCLPICSMQIDKVPMCSLKIVNYLRSLSLVLLSRFIFNNSIL